MQCTRAVFSGFHEPVSIKARDLLKQCPLPDLSGILAKTRHFRFFISAFDILEVLDTGPEEYLQLRLSESCHSHQMNQIMLKYGFKSLHNQHLLDVSKKRQKQMKRQLALAGTIRVLITSFCKSFMG